MHQKIVQEVCGHAQITPTLGTYSHVLSEAQAVEAMNGLLGGCAQRNLIKSASSCGHGTELIATKRARLASNSLRRAVSPPLYFHSQIVEGESEAVAVRAGA